MSGDDFDAFLKRYGLERNRQCLLDNEYDTIDSILDMPGEEMSAIGLKSGAITKIKRAQRDHNQQAITTPTAPPVVAISTSTLTPAANEREYNPPVLNPEWTCTNGFHIHDIFISYRVASEEVTAVKLHSALSAGRVGEQHPSHVYLDARCLENGLDWEDGFMNGLANSKVIVLLLSEAGLKRTKNANTRPDNQFLEIELALKQMKETQNTRSPVQILPILIKSSVMIDGTKYTRDWFPNTNDFPNAIHCHRASPSNLHQISPPLTVRQTLEELLKLQALIAADDYAVTKLVPEIRETWKKTSLVATVPAYLPSGSTVLTANENHALRLLLSPIDSTLDRQALEHLFVEGTRQWLFDQTTEWVNQDTTDTVLWVNAVAGVGKSVAAAQIANILQANAQLVSALFLKYNDTRKSDPRVVLNTIAYGLCKWYSPIGRKLLEAGHKKDDLDKMSINDLFKAVIADPLEAIGEYRPKGSVMILVDGLDECSPRDQLLSLLAWRFVELSRTRPWFKLLLTSRPEEDIKAAFDGVPTKTIEPSSEENIRDLEVFIRHRLRVYDTLSDLDRTEAVAILLDQSKTFVWINLILNTVDAASTDGPVTLTTIKDINDSAADVGQLYHKTFAKIHSQSSHPAELVTVVSAIATAQSILTPQIIADVFGLEIGVVCECLKSLSLVLDPGANGLGPRGSPSTNTEVKFNHKSVADYLLGDASAGHPWHVSGSFHTVFAQGCLGVILSHEPVVNICEIYDFHDNTPDLEDRVADKITPSLRYSVAHWITHFVWCVEGVAESSSVWQSAETVDAAAVLTRFVKTHVFFWLECGSLTHRIQEIAEQLAVLRGVIDKAPSTIVDDTTKELVKDTYRFIREFADPIIKSAPQVYNSGFAFTPKETAIYKTYADRLEDKIPFLVTAGPAPTWDPCEMTMSGHDGGVNSMAISLDAKWIVSGSGDKTIKMWHAATGQLKHTLDGHENSVNSVVISPDGRWIVSGSEDRTIKVWDIITGQLKHTLKRHTKEVNSVAISPDGRWIVSGSSDKTIKVWSAATGQWKYNLKGHTGYVNSVAISSDGEWIASGSSDNTIKVWDISTGQVKHTLEGHEKSVNSVAISPDGKWIASGSDDKTIKVWDATTGQLKHTLEGHTDTATSTAFSPDGKWVVSGSRDKTIKVWDAVTGQLKHTLEGHTYWVYSLTFSPDGKWIASGSRDKTIKIWDTATGRVKRIIEGHTNNVNSVAISPNGEWIASGSTDKTIKVWDISTGQVKHTLEEHTNIVTSVAFSPDDRWIASGSGDKTIKVWDISTGQVKHTLEGHTYWVYSLTFSPDGKWIASGSRDKTIKIWDTATGRVKRIIEGHTNNVNSVAISPNGEWIASGSTDKTIKVWDASAGQLKHTLEEHTDIVTSVAFSPDGKWVVSGSRDKTIKVWDATTGQVKHTLEGHPNYMNSMAISFEGNPIKIWAWDNSRTCFVRRGDQWISSNYNPTNFIAASDSNSSSQWIGIDNAPQWIRHGSHRIKIPLLLFSSAHCFTPPSGVFFVMSKINPVRPVIILRSG